MRTKILNNIGVTLVKLGRYEDGLAAFEVSFNSNDYAQFSLGRNVSTEASPIMEWHST